MPTGRCAGIAGWWRGGGAAEIEVAQQVGAAGWEGVVGIAGVWVVVYLVEVDPNGGDVQACRFKSI